MVSLVAGCKALEDIQGLFRRGFLHLHPPEAAFQCSILLDMGAELFVGRGTDDLHLAPCEDRFQDAGCIDCAFRRPCAHDGVELVHKQDCAAVPHQFFQQILETLFKIAAVLGARHKAGHIQCQQPSAFQRLRNIPGRDALGKTLSKSCLANARFPHKAGVIFLAAAEDLDHTVQLGVPADPVPVRRRGGSGHGNIYRWHGSRGVH